MQIFFFGENFYFLDTCPPLACKDKKHSCVITLLMTHQSIALQNGGNMKMYKIKNVQKRVGALSDGLLSFLASFKSGGGWVACEYK